MYFKRAHRVETQQNIELMTFVVSSSVIFFVGCSLAPTFFGKSRPFLILSITDQKTKRLNYSSYTIQLVSNWCMDTGVRDLEVAYFKANYT